MGFIIGTLECSDPRTGQQRLLGAVSGTPQEAQTTYEAMRPHLDPSIELVPPIELPKKCKCVVPRLYAYARDQQLIVHGMTLAVYETGKKIKPCWYCWWNADNIMAGVPTVQR